MENQFSLALTLRDGFAFEVDFGNGMPPLLIDEPPPLGAGEGPNAARLLAAAIGNCLSASLLFCLYKSRIEVAGMRTAVDGDLVRNGAGRLRIGTIRVRLEPVVALEQQPRLERCLPLFEDFCTVTASVRDALDVRVEVAPVAASVPQLAG